MTALLLAVIALPAAAETQNTYLKSDTVRVQRRAGKQIRTWTGNVRYSRGLRRAQAEQLVHDEVSGVVTAHGRIKAEQDLKGGARLTVAGESARHVVAAGAGVLKRPGGRLDIRRYSAHGRRQGRGSAEQISWNEKEQTLKLEGDVAFKDERGSLACDVAVISKPLDRLRLEGGRPVLATREKTWAAAVQAERIDIYQGETDSRRVGGDGGARGWIHFPNRPELSK